MLRWMIASMWLLGLIAAMVNGDPCHAADEEPGFVPLFDGQTLDGWEGDAKVFRVENGAIVAGSLKAPVAHNEFLCTKKEFGDFELRLSAKLVGEGKNAGVQFRSQRVPNHYEVSGYQADIGEMNGASIWGWLYDESRRNKFLVKAEGEQLLKQLKAGDWNDLVIRCEGPRVQIWVNKLQIVDYSEAEEGIARSGIIGLQIHGGPPAEASYKNIRIRELK